MKIALHGATGRMGAAVLRLATSRGDTIVGATGASGCDEIGRDLGEVHGMRSLGVLVQEDVGSALLGAEVVIDFSHADAVAKLAHEARRAGVPIVSGTTRLDEATEKSLDRASREVAVLWAPNFSFGIWVLTELVRHAVKRLGAEFDVEVVELHHRRKVDAPSGTALRIAREVESERGKMQHIYGREGTPGARQQDEMAVLAVRGGDVVGDHTVHLLGQNERLEITHRATSREVFAYGALVSAARLIPKPPGRYTLADILPA